MESNILLVNSDSAGTETLKNLVLPGVGQFTILDENLLTEADLGSNFFVQASGLGKPRCDTVTELLCEMNSDVRGNAIFGNVSSAIAADPNFLSRFNLVVASNLPEAHILQLSESCWHRNIPMLVVRGYGLIGYIRIQTKCHDIIESKPDGQTAPVMWDLRIANPFPELAAFCEQIDFSTLDWSTHVHVPYVIILTNLLAQWKASHGGALPSTKAEREAFVDEIKSLTNNNAPSDYPQAQEGGVESKLWPGYLEANNFQEAVKEAYRAYVPLRLPSELEDLLQELNGALEQASDSSIMLHALRIFMNQSGGDVPLSGQIPDMFSSTTMFIALQEVYQRKAGSDRAQFASIVAQQLTAGGRNPSSISSETIDIFCKNIYNLRRVSTRSIAHEHTEPHRENLCAAVEEGTEGATSLDPLQTPILWYMALRAADRYCSKHGHWPGSSSDDASVLLEEADSVWAECQSLAAEWGMSEQVADILTRNHAVEIVRYGAADIHNVGAVVGGIAAQEAVKLITHQYVPINNTYIYNGIVCAGKVYGL